MKELNSCLWELFIRLACHEYNTFFVRVTRRIDRYPSEFSPNTVAFASDISGAEYEIL